MDANIDRLNVNVGGVRPAGFTGRAELLRELERASGVALPDSYLRFVRQVDGGHPEVGSFVPTGADPGERFDVDQFYSVTNPHVDRLSDALESWCGVLGPGALPIARDGGGNQIFLRAGPGQPSVWLYVHDSAAPERRVADTFEAFLEGLHENPDLI